MAKGVNVCMRAYDATSEITSQERLTSANAE